MDGFCCSKRYVVVVQCNYGILMLAVKLLVRTEGMAQYVWDLYIDKRKQRQRDSAAVLDRNQNGMV